MLRSEEQVMHERQRTSKKLEDKLTVEQSRLNCSVALFWKIVVNIQQLVISNVFVFFQIPVLISIRCR